MNYRSCHPVGSENELDVYFGSIGGYFELQMGVAENYFGVRIEVLVAPWVYFESLIVGRERPAVFVQHLGSGNYQVVEIYIH